YTPVAPKFIGRRVFKQWDLADLVPCIDWTPFFQTWDLAGPYPAILNDEVVGEQARKVFADAQAMLKKIVEGRWLTANAVVGLYPANTVHDDDIALYTDASRTQVALTWHGLRQQTEKQAIDGPDGQPVMRPSRCLSDFVAPQGSEVEDYVGVFAVTAGLGVDAREQGFLAQHDDYNAIMLKALADRLAEALAERLHQRVRTDLWGYAPHEALGNDDLIAEKYQGIRPAPGYPACPDHTVKRDLFALLPCEEIDMGLTDSLAMTPAASVSGFYLAHPDSVYFNVGKIGHDQLQDMAERRGLPEADLARWLAPNL
ncbi:MAG TPA: vitamin B12 dependent-methionine synthase activation domain-containing protein, partial [Macromonas sp.]|nr:vitamin B12 dependent-methionine synthase activation domain-containing protein [Macromonas sp.]